MITHTYTHTHVHIYTLNVRGVIVTVTVVGNELSDTSSKPEWDCLHFSNTDSTLKRAGIQSFSFQLWVNGWEDKAPQCRYPTDQGEENLWIQTC